MYVLSNMNLKSRDDFKYKSVSITKFLEGSKVRADEARYKGAAKYFSKPTLLRQNSFCSKMVHIVVTVYYLIHSCRGSTKPLYSYVDDFLKADDRIPVIHDCTNYPYKRSSHLMITKTHWLVNCIIIPSDD